MPAFAPLCAAAVRPRTNPGVTAATPPEASRRPANQLWLSPSRCPRATNSLSIAPQVNGPLKVSGALEIVSGTGHTINRTQTTFLCRCGGSANKPYCDGTHKKNGFIAP